MFVRVKKSGSRQYLQVVESRWEEGVTRQRVVATLGRVDKLQAKGDVDALMRSLARFANRVRVAEDEAFEPPVGHILAVRLSAGAVPVPQHSRQAGASRSAGFFAIPAPWREGRTCCHALAALS